MFNCQLCVSTFSTRNEYKLHVSRYHQNQVRVIISGQREVLERRVDGGFMCPKCEYKTVWPSNIVRHCHSNHKGMFICDGGIMIL
jgi:hypothetical protein